MGNFKILIIAVILNCQPMWANAQETTTNEEATKVESVSTEVEAPSESNNGRIEKLEVTGSHIRRTDVEGPSPVLVIDRAEIEKSGLNSVGAILRRSTVSPFGGSGSTVSLKGLGSARTLVLINGHRAPASGSSYSSGAVSVNFVPVAAVERIEVLKDGASATYGSDALGGVINIITRKDLDGYSFADQLTISETNGSDSNRMSLAYGSSTAKSDFLTSVQLNYVQGSRTSDLDYAKDLNNSFVFSTNYVGDSGIQPGPSCTKLDDNGRCAEQVSPKQVTKPSYSLDWVTDAKYRLAGETSLYTTVILGYGRSEDEFPNVLNTPGQHIGVDFTGAETPSSWNSIPDYSGGDTRVWHRMDDLVNKSISHNYNGGVILGVRGYVGESDWEWDVSANNQVNINETHEADLATLSGTRAAFISDQYNPFDVSNRNTAGMAIDAMNRHRYMVNWVEGKTNGGLGEFLGFDWASAFGISAANYEYSDNRADAILSGDTMLQSGTAGKGGRQLYSAFTELSGVIGKTLEVQLSARSDNYSDFGSTVNPKIALRYQPIKSLTFRTSFGTGFQAPTLQDMNANVEGFNFLVDQVRCKDPSLGNSDPNSSDCATQSISSLQASNADLKQETSQSFNFGAIYQPTKSFSIAADWWLVNVEDTIGANLDDLLEIEVLDASAPLNKYNTNIIRNGGSPTGKIERIEYQLTNVGKDTANGIDVDANYRLVTSIGKFNFKNEFVYMFHREQEFYEEFGREEQLGQFGVPRWRNNVTVSYSVNDWDFRTVARTIARTEKNVRGIGDIESVTQYDLIVTFDPSWAGEFQAGGINLFNIRPRFDTSFSTRINGSLYQRLQTFFVGYRQDF